MRLSVNGETRSVEEGATLAAFLADLEIDPRKVAVERNREIVPKSLYGAVELADGDVLEIVQFVGGG